MNISVFCGATLPRNPEYIHAARHLGQLLAQGGHTLLYGGSNLGLMGTVSGAVLEGGGRVVGVIPSFFTEEIILSQPVTELVRVATIAERKEYGPPLQLRRRPFLQPPPLPVRLRFQAAYFESCFTGSKTSLDFVRL